MIRFKNDLNQFSEIWGFVNNSPKAVTKLLLWLWSILECVLVPVDDYFGGNTYDRAIFERNQICLFPKTGKDWQITRQISASRVVVCG